jgi:hypothetical protein
MTQIEAKMANIAQGKSVDGTLTNGGEISAEALALFSALFAQIKLDPEMAEAPNASQAGQANSRKDLLTPVEFNQDQLFKGGVADELTRLLVAAQQVAGTASGSDKTGEKPIDNDLFSDMPMAPADNEVAAIVQHAANVLRQRQLISTNEISRLKTAYKGEVNPVSDLVKQLRVAAIASSKAPADQVFAAEANLAALTSSTDIADAVSDELLAAEAAPIVLASGEIVNAVPAAMVNLEQTPTLVQGPPQADGRGPVPLALARLIQGPPQANGQGPVVPEVARHLQGPVMADGTPPLDPTRPSNVNVPPQSGVNVSLQAGDVALRDMLGADDGSAKMLLKPSEGVAPETEHDSEYSFISRDRQLLAPQAGQKEIMALKTGARDPLDVATSPERATHMVSGKIANGDPLRMTFVDDAGEAVVQSQANAQTNQQNTGQQGGQSGREQQAFVSADAKGNAAEKTEAYRLNVQQKGWTDNMVRQLQTTLRQGGGDIKIVLEPRHMGRLHVSMMLRGGRASIRVATDTLQAASLLQDSRAQLAQMFDQAGMRLASLQTSASVIGGDAGAGGDGSGSQTAFDQQTAGQNANKDGKNSEQGNRLSTDIIDGDDMAQIGSVDALSPGETAVLNVLA